jgi:hypothetical protein
MTLAHFTSWNIAWGTVVIGVDRGGHLVDGSGRQTVDNRRGRGRGGAGGGHGDGMRDRPRAATQPSVGSTFLLGPSLGGVDRSVGRIPPGALHVHRLGERPGAGRGEPESGENCSESPLHLDRRRGPAFCVLLVRHGHRVSRRRLVHRSVLGPFPDRGRPCPRRRGGGGLDRRDRVRPRRLGGGLELTGEDALPRRTTGASAGVARPGALQGRHPCPRTRGHGRYRPRHHRRMGHRPRRRGGHRIDESGRPLRRVFHHGHNRHPGRLCAHRPIAPRLHVASSPHHVLAPGATSSYPLSDRSL